MIPCAGCRGSALSTRLPRRARLPRTRPSRTRGTVVMGLVLAITALPAPESHAQEDLLGEIKTVASVRFQGRRRVGARELRSVMKTKPPSPWPWHDRPILRGDFLRSDSLAIRDRYVFHGFLDAHVNVIVSA